MTGIAPSAFIPAKPQVSLSAEIR